MLEPVRETELKTKMQSCGGWLQLLWKNVVPSSSN